MYPVEGERSIDIAAPPERVWALVADVARMRFGQRDRLARGVEETLRRLKAAAEAG